MCAIFLRKHNVKIRIFTYSGRKVRRPVDEMRADQCGKVLGWAMRLRAAGRVDGDGQAEATTCSNDTNEDLGARSAVLRVLRRIRNFSDIRGIVLQ